MTDKPGSTDTHVLSYLGLRKAVGYIGIALPFALAFGRMLLDAPGIRGSISSYYYTSMRDVFVGSLCAIAVFMMSYRGYGWKDDIAGDLAGVFALGAALFPTKPDANVTARHETIAALHLTFAAAFFLMLAYFSLVQFRKTDTKTPTREKLQRNVVYTFCGYTILACLALIAGTKFLPYDSPVHSLNPLFWLESVAIVAFGMSWLTKGEAILWDEPNESKTPVARVGEPRQDPGLN